MSLTKLTNGEGKRMDDKKKFWVHLIVLIILWGVTIMGFATGYTRSALSSAILDIVLSILFLRKLKRGDYGDD